MPASPTQPEGSIAGVNAQTSTGQPLRWNYIINGGGANLPFYEAPVSEGNPENARGDSRPYASIEQPQRTVFMAEGKENNWWFNNAGAVIALTTSSASIAPTAKSGTVDHVVLVWLKRPGNVQDQQALIKLGHDLRVIPGLQFLDSGTALPSERPTVDDSFDVGYVMRFDSPAALEAYAVHPVHVEAKDDLVRLIRKLLVYDVTR